MSTEITRELLAEIKRLDEKAAGTFGSLSALEKLQVLARTALPALARRVEELEAEIAHLAAPCQIDGCQFARATAAEQQRDEMAKALDEGRKLANEVRGILSAAEPMLREAIGNTNYVALALRSRRFDASLASLTPKEPA